MPWPQRPLLSNFWRRKSNSARIKRTYIWREFQASYPPPCLRSSVRVHNANKDRVCVIGNSRIEYFQKGNFARLRNVRLVPFPFMNWSVQYITINILSWLQFCLKFMSTTSRRIFRVTISMLDFRETLILISIKIGLFARRLDLFATPQSLIGSRAQQCPTRLHSKQGSDGTSLMPIVPNTPWHHCGSWRYKYSTAEPRKASTLVFLSHFFSTVFLRFRLFAMKTAAISFLTAAATFLPALVHGTPLVQRQSHNAPHFVIYQDGTTTPRWIVDGSLMLHPIQLGHPARTVPHRYRSLQVITSSKSCPNHICRDIIWLWPIYLYNSILSFLLLRGAADQAKQWESLSAATRKSVKSAYSAAGISLMVSAFGSTDTPVSSGANAVGTANKMAKWVKQYDLDGIDVDFEDLAAVKCAAFLFHFRWFRG